MVRMPNTATRLSRMPATVDGEKLRRRRIEAGLTAAMLGKRAAASTNHICDIERGRRNPSAPLLKRIASSLNLAPADLLHPERAGR
jgi:transcriptional regulator with XRE-family HTH domain